MIRGGKGGANTLTGLAFEKKVGFATFFEKQKGYSVKKASIGYEIYFEGKLVAHSYRQHSLYHFLKSEGVCWEKIISQKLLPDEALYVIVKNTLYVIEIKFQNCEGSVDEKLQTCDFKRKQYKKLMAQLNIDVEYIYILNEWFKKPRYKDTLDYIISSSCHYYFNHIPLNKIGLPTPSA